MYADDKAPELYRRYRPRKFSDVLGQPQAVSMLREKAKTGTVPHCLLLSGPSGCGKTTIARILQKVLKCSDADFREMNIADVRGIDMVREIRSKMHLSPIGGNTRIWLLDECARGTVDAQNAFLKMFEDTPEHVYFILATTEPMKLLSTIRTRATEVKLLPLDARIMIELIDRVATAEEIVLTGEVKDMIVTTAEGSPRKALVLLGQVASVSGEEDQLAVIEASAGSPTAIEIARALMKHSPWSTVAKLLKECQDDPESVRHVVLGYFGSVMLGGGKTARRAFEVVDIFSKPFYDSKKAGLVAACFEAIEGA